MKPTTQELNNLICDELGYEHFGPGANSHSELFGTLEELRSLVLTALVRYGIHRPIPVTERLPGAEDCDAEGRCWCFTPQENVEPTLVFHARWILSKLTSCDTHWLPAHDLPLPTTLENTDD